MTEHFSNTLLDQKAYNHDLLFAVTDNAADGIIVIDEAGKILLANKAACVIFAYFPTQMIGNNVTMLMPKEHGRHHQDYVERYLDTRKGVIIGKGVREVIGLRSDGVKLPLEMSIAAVSLDEDQTIFIANFRDSTEQIRIAKKLRRQAQIIEQIKDGVVVADMDRRVIACNAVMKEIVGLPTEEIVGKKVFNLIEALLPEEITLISMREHALEHGFWNGQFQIVNAIGAKLWVDVTVTPQHDHNNEVDAFISVWRDITTRREAEATAARSERIESLGRVAGGVAHDINNLLFPLFLSLDEAMMSLKELEQVDTVREIKDRVFDALSAGINIKEVVQNIMVFSHQDSTEVTDVDTVHLVNDIWRIAKLCIPSSVTVETNFTEASGQIRATGTSISQVFVNLLSNAVDAVDTAKGLLKISTTVVNGEDCEKPRLFQLRPGQRYLLLTVEDNGTGMSDELMDKIFDPFFTTKDVGEGSGIGMSQVSQIVQDMGGAINVRSTVGKGSIFDIYFPVD